MIMGLALDLYFCLICMELMHGVPNNIVHNWHPLLMQYQWEPILIDNFPPVPKSERNDPATFYLRY